MNVFNELDNKMLPKVQNGYAKDIPNFFENLIQFQFEKKEEIKKIHSSLLKYINSKSPVFFLRLYGSYTKAKYHLQRRGFLSEYKDKTRLSFCDNTFTLLFTGMKLAGIPYSYEDLVQLFGQKKLIVGFGQVSEEKELSFYSPKGAKRANINAKGWYQAHIKPTGYGYRDINLTTLFPNPARELFQEPNFIRKINNTLTNEQLEILRAHFLRLIHPFNSFLVPKRNHIEYNGNNIGEENILINYVREYLVNSFPNEYAEFDEQSIKYIVPESDNSIGEIKWFENPKNKPKLSKVNNSKERETSKSNKTILEESENEIESELNIEKSLRAIGKEIYATILYPEISKNIDINHQEISNKYFKYNSFTENSQRSRLSKAKSIFRAGGEIEALINVYESNKINPEIKEYVNELIKNGS
ncbi:hypothetical protein GSB9_03168 [Flavobacteriaceae bacterium GSB9]|nr:hypothetical protein GSB9_03168 [Flavobacteriaceae bacterium GSB9]